MSRTANNKSPSQKTQAVEAFPSLGVADALTLLFRKAMPNLDVRDLEGLAFLSYDAAEIAQRAAHAATGIAQLVLSDHHEENVIAAGNFRSGEDVSDLLLHFADVFRSVDALIGLSSDAQLVLNEKGGAA